MSRYQLEPNWKQIECQVKSMWRKLTAEDLLVIRGREHLLAGKIQERYGVASDRAAAEVRTFLYAFERKSKIEMARGEREDVDI